jgi:limonene-1,2-epoxide hydrolase
MNIPVCNVLEVRDGKIYREREYMDMATMMVQLGVMPVGALA